MADTLALVNPSHFSITALENVLKRRLSERPGKAGRRDASFCFPSTFSLPPVVCLNNSIVLQDDLMSILGGRVPRSHGDLPEELGLYEMIAPSHAYTRVVRMKRG